MNEKNKKNEYFLVTIPANGLRLNAGRMESKPITLKTLQSEVGGLVEAVAIREPIKGLEMLDAFVNEDGIDAGLSLNMAATMLLKHPIFGNLVLCRYSQDGNSYPLSREELDRLADIMGGLVKSFCEWAENRANVEEEKGIFREV